MSLNIIYRILSPAILFTIFFSSVQLFAHQVNEPAQKVRVVVLKDLRPSTFVDTKNGTLNGFGIDLVKHVAAKAGLKVSFMIVDDWQSAEEALKKGEADLCPVMAINDKRKNDFIFSKPVESFNISIAVRSHNNEIKDTASLKGKDVGVIREGQAHYILKALKGINLIEYNLFQVAMFDLLAGRIDAFVAPESVIRNISIEAGIDKLIDIVEPPVSESKRAFAFSKNNFSLYKDLIPIIDDFISSEEYKVIYSKWFLSPPPYWNLKRVFIGFIIIFIITLAILAFIYYRSIIRMNHRLNAMVVEKEGVICQLNNSMQKIREINEELAKAKERAEESNRLKTAFLQNLSHEIRTPMNAIMGFAELIPRNFDNKEKLKTYSKLINQRSNDLLEIINEILEISMIETGQILLHIEECDLNQMMDEIEEFFEEFKKKIKKEHIDFIVKKDCNNPVYRSDKTKLKQILINLISNAFKFTYQGIIEAGYSCDKENEILFFVRDTGMGIPKEKQQLIFERFYQIRPEAEETTGGAGLGLPIVKGLVSLLKGRIWLESEVGEGTIFYVAIPVDNKTMNTNTSSEKSEVIQNDAFKNKSVLIVDDDRVNTELLCEFLEDTGIQIFMARTASEALEKALSLNIDIVLLDIRLPDRNGDEIATEIKKSKPGIYIIAQTAYAFETDKQRFLKAGCDDFISKPIDRGKLIEIMSRCFCLK